MQEAPSQLSTDGFGRRISYLRISVTDKCNFRCVYCMPEEGVATRAHSELLSAEDIARFVRIAAQEGVERIRLTGGEPLVSNRIVPLIAALHDIDGINDISLTTNGALLPRMAKDLQLAGLNRVNISLDTLDEEQFSAITRVGRLEQALHGIDAALAWGFEPVKVNTVVVRRLNQDLMGLAKLSVDRPIHVRFIEYMPIGNDHTIAACSSRSSELDPGQWNERDIVPSEELRQTISALGVEQGLGALCPASNNEPLGAGPAAYWKFEHAQGTVGFITAMSNHFCSQCNRMRLTADGKIRPCLFSDVEYSVREALRAHDDEQVRRIWRQALQHKPQKHDHTDGTARFMSQIGG